MLKPSTTILNPASSSGRSRASAKHDTTQEVLGHNAYLYNPEYEGLNQSDGVRYYELTALIAKAHEPKNQIQEQVP